ncbi:ABC transporter ATP-binding protein [Nonomuraea sp. NPDC050310]|uniref:ABC transporter ATP-binding protein n=1 Tax=unclassified Nonomuraea TaxID=2593643 RepID=UPI00340BA3A8
MITGENITKTFKQRGNVLDKREVRALRGVDFSIPRGGAASFIGESGCGKTTLGRILAGLESYDGGEITIDGVPMSGLKPKARQPYFRRIQMIHQDPYSALNPTRTIQQTLFAPLQLRAKQTGRDAKWIEERAAEVLSLVGLDPGTVLGRYPHQLSGGMRQRVVIARALTVDPEMLVADEATSMIDVSLRLGILALLKDLRERLNVSVLFITHDVATARYIGDDGDLYVIYRGQVVEQGKVDTVIADPVHPYTQALLSAIPVLHGLEVPGEEPVVPTSGLDESKEDTGCLFARRCPFATEACTAAPPPLQLTEGVPQRHACIHPRRRSVVAREV